MKTYNAQVFSKEKYLLGEHYGQKVFHSGTRRNSKNLLF